MNEGEPGRERWVLPEVGRRRFLIGAAAAAATVVVTVSCGSGDSDGKGGDGSTTTAPRRAVDPVDAPKRDWGDRSVFPLGVASGDPTSDSVILWTRLAL